MNMMITAKPIQRTPIAARLPVLKVIGLGGGGSNAVNRMIELGLGGVEYIAANTDAQALKNSLAPIKIQLGPRLTRGLGAGGDPKIGEEASEESYRDLNQALAGADMVFLTAGMGGGTGTGSIPIAARVARSIGAVVVAIITTPFTFEVGRRQVNAREGINRLRQYTDTLITVPNDRLLQIAPRDLTLDLAFRMADDMLRQGIQGISELVTQPGLINVDFAHVRQMMMNGGGSLLSMGYGQGENKAINAIEQALHHPMLESVSLENATGIIANFSGGPDLTFMEIADALNYLQSKTNFQAEIIPGVTNDEKLTGRAQVILVITGLGATPLENVSTRRKAEQPVETQQQAKPAVETPAAALPVYPVNQIPVELPQQGRMQPEEMLVDSYAGYNNMRSQSPVVRERTSMADLGGNTIDLELPAFLRRRVNTTPIPRGAQ
ncbi:MAG: cell division protein FtsZ [Anaerolineae bacterium]|nr:cell division protein FtsZ [Anaerolineae bacterium]